MVAVCGVMARLTELSWTQAGFSRQVQLSGVGGT